MQSQPIHPYRILLGLTLAGLLAWTGTLTAQPLLDGPGAEARFLETAPPGWLPISPGVWELEETDGTISRRGFGHDGLRFLLDEVETRRADLLDTTPPEELPAHAERLAELDRTIQYLQAIVGQLKPRAQNAALPAHRVARHRCEGHADLRPRVVPFRQGGLACSTAAFFEVVPSHRADLLTTATAGADLDSDSVAGLTGASAQAHAGSSEPGCALEALAVVAVPECGAYEWASHTGNCGRWVLFPR